MDHQSIRPTPAGPRAFRTTRWSQVLAASDQRSEIQGPALAGLCRDYWRPLYTFVRRLGHDADDAADLTQAFFVHVLEKQSLRVADPERGRFRSFLLTSIKNFVGEHGRRRRALKRGGGVEMVALDLPSGEQRQLEPEDERLSPEAAYQRRWAMTVLHAGLRRLRRRYHEQGKGPLFDSLRGHLGLGGEVRSFGELAAETGLSEGSLRTAVSRLRGRWRDEVRAVVRDTVQREEDVDEEVRHLSTFVGRP